jgi:hypothetical protein
MKTVELAAYGSDMSTTWARASEAVKVAITASALSVCSSGMRLSFVAVTNSTFAPSDAPRAFATSMSKPSWVPFEFITPYPGESALTAILTVLDLRICVRWLSATAPVAAAPGPFEAPPDEQPPKVRAKATAGTRSNFGVALNMSTLLVIIYCVAEAD